MRFLDRLFGKPPKPQMFCTQCGSAMVDGYVVMDTGFSPSTGRPMENRARTRVCVNIHAQSILDSRRHDPTWITWRGNDMAAWEEIMWEKGS